MRKEWLVGVLLLGLITVFCQDGLAQTTHPTGGKIKLGRLTVIPGFTLQEVYDDNIFLGNGNNNNTELKESDWITHTVPSLLLNYQLDGRGQVNAGYLGDYAWYRDNDAMDWKSHTALFNADYEAPGGLIAGIDNTYIDTADPFGDVNQYRLGQQTKRWNDLLQTKLGYRFSDRFKMLGYYNYYKQDYDLERDFTQDFDSNEFGLGAHVKVMPLTWAFIRYYYGERDYNSYAFGVNESNDADYDWHRVNVGLAWDPEGKLKGELNFGYEWQDHENNFDSSGRRYENEDSWIAGTKISYSATSTTTLTLTIFRAFRYSGSDTAEYFEDTGGSIGIIQALHYRLNLLANVGYSMNEYNLPADNPKSQDNYIATIGLEYKLMEWLAAIASYTHNRKESNYEVDEYRDNQVLVGLRAVY